MQLTRGRCFIEALSVISMQKMKNGGYNIFINIQIQKCLHYYFLYVSHISFLLAVVVPIILIFFFFKKAPTVKPVEQPEEKKEVPVEQKKKVVYSFYLSM